MSQHYYVLLIFDSRSRRFGEFRYGDAAFSLTQFSLEEQ